MTTRVLHVAGARPNFMKIAPLLEAFGARPTLPSRLVHTGQHYSPEMSALFFDELGIPKPDVDLEVGSGSHAQQTALLLQRFEPVLLAEKPDLVLVVGDVNSTIACALTAVKLGVPVAHVEAGLRSFDRSMPEEINRVLTDAISDLLFVSEPSGVDNLIREGCDPSRIHLVGNVMIDTLMKHRARAAASDILERLGLAPSRYGVVTLHRPANVDDPAAFARILEPILELSRELPLVFPVHPRTRPRLEAAAGGAPGGSLIPVDPLGYLDFLRLMQDARVVLTDSGGIQEETTILGVACVTLRDNTERPITVTHGTNRLGGTSADSIRRAIAATMASPPPRRPAPPLWDGSAAVRVADAIEAWADRRA
jgi:UDP-N-acetylglucosamine 2-epimerase (non-hydrolysing)